MLVVMQSDASRQQIDAVLDAIVVDPSHGTGKRAYVPAMSLAALAAGADGLLIEIHPDPDRAMSDGAQSLDFPAFQKLLGQLRKLADLFGRRV
jgi:3-deoxy-7-phosphoheptulonate synthase